MNMKDNIIMKNDTNFASNCFVRKCSGHCTVLFISEVSNCDDSLLICADFYFVLKSNNELNLKASFCNVNAKKRFVLLIFFWTDKIHHFTFAI